MSTHYTTEPPPTASVLLHTSAGPIQLSLFAQQTPLTSRNFLQHCLDGTYDNCTFHRISPGFVIQTGDPTNTGEGGQSIYDLEKNFERYDALWARETGREVGEKIDFKDEIHSRLKFNRRGLVGMAKMGEGYGSQFFITLADCRRQLDGQCTMFGRVEGDGIYNVVKISEGELAQDTERPIFPDKILRVEVLEMPKGDAWQAMKKRERVATQVDVEEERPKKVAKREKKKGGKALLSFADDEGEGEGFSIKPKKAKFNPTLIQGGDELDGLSSRNEPAKIPPATATSVQRKAKSPSPSPARISKPSHSTSPPLSRSPEASHRHRPSFHDPTTQLPLRDPEVPSRSRSSTPTLSSSPPRRRLSHNKPKTSDLNAEIAALKASMRRGPAYNSNDSNHTNKHLSALEQMIPTTSIRGRKRPRPGDGSSKNDTAALNMLNAFRARLDGADRLPAATSASSHGQRLPPLSNGDANQQSPTKAAEDEDEEARLCDLHFIANCQSCQRWDNTAFPDDLREQEEEEAGDRQWMSHALKFEKDRLGKDLTWRKKAEEDLVVIDPREKEKEIKKGARRERDRREGYR